MSGGREQVGHAVAVALSGLLRLPLWGLAAIAGGGVTVTGLLAVTNNART